MEDPARKKLEVRCTQCSAELNCRVLLVEDNLDHQPLLSLILRNAGSQVTIAENGKVAVELAHAARDQGRPFDIILMDVQMPVLDGLGATRMLRSSGFTRPIIALSARATHADHQKCLEAGCDDFLSKPIDRAELLQRLASHLAKAALSN